MMDSIIDDLAPDGVFAEDMADYEVSHHSKREIVAAGRVLAEKITTVDDGTLEVFRIAHSWRNAHILPMIRIRQDVSAKCRQIQTGAITAARLKRMSSIRRKITKTDRTLYQLHDIGGCRVIFDSMAEVNALIGQYRAGKSRHSINREWDHISNPAADGYRSHHLVFKFNGKGSEAVYNRQTIELQVRTKLQHAWATAVEAVGLVRRENLKNGEGDPDWRRFFKIMASEFALIEQCPICPGVSENAKERLDELKSLESKLGAVRSLESYKNVIQYTEETHRNLLSRAGGPRQYLLQYNYTDSRVTIEPHLPASSSRYAEEERNDATFNTVLVEGDRVADLKAAFPNYFLDVTMFADQLRGIMGMAPRPSIAVRPEVAAAVPSTWLSDLRWVRNWRYRK